MQEDSEMYRVAIRMSFELLPLEPAESPFFSDAARHLVCGVLTSFMKSRIDWTLDDLVLLFLTGRKHLKAVLSKHRVTRHLVQRYFHDDRLLPHILATAMRKLDQARLLRAQSTDS